MVRKFEPNTKQVQGRERKAALLAEKKRQEEEKREMAAQKEWQVGAKDVRKQIQMKEKQQAKQAKKQERKQELESEEQSIGPGPKSDGSFAASTIEDALTLLGANSVKIEQHPERRMRAAYLEFEASRLPELKQQLPTLRLSQHKQLLQREWRKSPQNPFNQPHLPYNVSAEEGERVVRHVLEHQTSLLQTDSRAQSK